MEKELTRRNFIAASAVGAASLLIPAGFAYAESTEEDGEGVQRSGLHDQARSERMSNPKLKSGFQGRSADVASAADLEAAVQWALGIAADDSHGYDQDNRWGPDFDCSSFVIQAFENAGFGVMEAGAAATLSMRSAFSAVGFQVLTDFSNLVRGDVLLNDADHTALYIGDNQIVEASINENGYTTGGLSGDQTGGEIHVGNYYWYESGWNCILRWPQGSGGSESAVQIWTPNGTDAQLWRIADVGGGVVVLLNKSSMKYLDVSNANYVEGNAVWAYPGNGSDAQGWIMEIVDRDLERALRFHTKIHPELLIACGDDGRGAGSTLWLSHDTGSMSHEFVPVYSKFENEISWYQLINRGTGLPLDVVNGV